MYDTLAAKYVQHAKGDIYHGTLVNAGGVYYNVTRAYPPKYIQTLPQGCYHGFGKYSALNVQDYINPPQNWQILDRCAMYFTFQIQSSYGGPNGTLMALSPQISLPPDITTYDPAWKHCYGNGPYNPLWDPPRVLTPVSALGGPTTTVLSPTLALSTAKPHAQPSSPQAMSTPIAVLRPTPSFLPIGDSGTTIANGPTPSAHTDTGIMDPVDPVIPVSNNPDRLHDPTDHDLKSTTTSRPTPAEILDAAGTIAETGDPEAQLQMIPQPSPIATLKENTIFGLANGAVSVHGQTLKVGDPAITVDAMPVSVGSSAVHIGQSSYRYTVPAVTRVAALESVYGNAIHILAQGGIEIGSSTILPGEQITIDGTALSVGPKKVVIGSSTYVIHNVAATTRAPSLPVINGEAVSMLKDGNILAGHSTVSIGESTTISGIPVSVGSNVMIVGGSTYTLPTPAPYGPKLGHQSISPAADGAVIIGSLTVSKGTQATISGTPISVGSGFIIIGSSTYPIQSKTQVISDLTGELFNTLSGGGILFDGVTVQSNAQTTISGTPVSVGSDLVMIGGKTYPWPSATGTLSVYSEDSIQRLPGGAIVLDGMTLPANIQTTISGTWISIKSGTIVINGVTQTRTSDFSSPTSGLGAVIASMFGFKPDSEDRQFSTDATTPMLGPSGGNGAGSASARTTPTPTPIPKPTLSVDTAAIPFTSNGFVLTIEFWILIVGISIYLASVG